MYTQVHVYVTRLDYMYMWLQKVTVDDVNV